MSNHSEAELALDKTKIALLRNPAAVFYATVALSLQHVISGEVPTAATNGTKVYYNPVFFMNLNTEERVFLMLHETMHCAYMHMYRAKVAGLDHCKANAAADYVINLQLVSAGFKMPKSGLLDHKYQNMSMEEVYKLLPEHHADPDHDDLLDPSDGDSQESASNAQHRIKEILVRAATVARSSNQANTIPNDIQIMIDKMLNPKLPWNVILRRYFQDICKNDYTWKRPNRRYMPNHYMPSLYSEALVDIAVAVDTSGSVTDEQFKQFITETNQIIKSFKPKCIHFIQFDTSIQSVDKVRNMNDLRKLKFTGRGGTDVNPVLEWANQNKPKVLLVFTDGYFYLEPIQTSVETVWLINDNPNFKASFGKAITYETEN